ncbi:glycosyltransferase [Pedobacter sp. AW31-3R]|uniref:glycosyltransferase n=1 Tax=Pedobacter sp. AW31-3R TaxID=3445781 RepID=UPI003FA14AF8
MKIAFFYRQLGQGGIQRMIVNCANFFNDHGHEVTLILIKPGGAYHELLNTGVKVIYFETISQLRLVGQLSGILKKGNFDLLYTATPDLNGFTILARMLSGTKTKVVISERNNTLVFFKNMKWSLSKLSFLTIPFLYRYADAIVAVSEGVKKGLKNVALLQEKRITVIYNPAYPPLLDDQLKIPVVHDWFEDKDVPVIVTVGRLTEAKNHVLLLDAMTLLRSKRPVRLIIVGEGPMRDVLKRKIQVYNLGGVVELAGFQLNPVAWMKSADVFVLSSDYEGFGNVLVEALAAGTTIVSTDCNYGPAEIVGTDFGYLTPTGDARSLAGQIDYALDHPIDKLKLRSRAQDFSLDHIMEQYSRLFKSLLE